MKHLTTAIALLALIMVAMSCSHESVWDKYEAWRLENNAWYQEQRQLRDDDGSLWYTELNPWWNPGSGVLIHYYNDTTLTRQFMSPIHTSTVNVIYRGEYCNGQAFDSSYTEVDSIRSFAINQSIGGWQTALYDMHIGDSVDIVVPYTQAYGMAGYNDIPPYSALKFSIKLKGIPYYEQRPD